MEEETSPPPPGPSSAIKAHNVLVDGILNEIRQRIIAQGYTEIHLPPSETEFSEKKLGITWNGTLILTNGKLRGLETMHRIGDALLGFNEYMNYGAAGQNAEMTFTVDLGFTEPTTTHDFRVIFMKKEMEGVATGNISDIIFAIVLGLNILTRRTRLIQLKFKHLGDVNTDIKGLGFVLDFLASKISKIMLNRTKWEMANVVEDPIKHIVSEVIGDMKCPMPEQQNLLIGGVQSVFGGGGGGAGVGGASNGEEGGEKSSSSPRNSK